MEGRTENSGEQIKRLQRGMNDLVSLLALPAMWSVDDSSQIGRTLRDVLLSMLNLDLVYVRLNNSAGAKPAEMVGIAPPSTLAVPPQEIGDTLKRWMGDDPQKWHPLVRNLLGHGDISIVPLSIGLQCELGVIVVASRRLDFPDQVERLLLDVAKNQAAIGLREARLLSEQKRIADELDRRVVQRTRELAAVNEELKKEIIERKAAEEELRRSETFLAEAQRLSSTGNFSWRLDTDEIAFSDELSRIFEFDRDTPVTLERIAARVHPDDIPLLTEKIEQARRTDAEVNYEIRLRMADGAVKYLHTITYRTRDLVDRSEIIGAVRDVSQRRLAEDALGKARSELAHMARVTSLGALTASIAHEVNQPLTGIVTNASTCLRMLAADPPNVEGARETARRIIRDGNRGADVIARLRALFTKKDIAVEMVDLTQATQEVVALSLSELQLRRLVVRMELSDDLPRIMGDRVQLQQVILNLLLNASDAMSNVNDRPRLLQIRTEYDNDKVCLTVQDSGVGLDPQIVDRLFDPFYTTKSTGMGIGLSVSRSIIENHRGRLWAASHDGPGATFSFSIPRAPALEMGATGVGTNRTRSVMDAQQVVRSQ